MAALIVEAALLLIVATIAGFSGAAAQEKDRTEEILRGNQYAARWIAGTVLFKLNGYHDAITKAASELPPGLKALAMGERSDSSRDIEQLFLPEPHAVISDASFCDPVLDGACEDDSGKTRPGGWLAGFAPIGNTGFVAIVETPREAAARPNQTLAWRLLLWGVLPFFLGTAPVAAVTHVVQRTRKQNKAEIKHSTKDA